MKFLVLIVLGFSLVNCAHHRKHPMMGDKGMHFEMMDTDKDGKVTRDEFDKAHGSMFAKMDANKDGVITEDEGKPKKEGACCGK